jgi:2-polyprenyl-3-methyl-5-hydroxy-6-metoxy-1,4-benzoquinol methylase
MMEAQHSGTCRLCGATATVAMHDFPQASIDSCSSCGFVQIRDLPSQNALRAIYTQNYFDHTKYEGDWASQREKLRRLSLLRQAGVPHQGGVLDAGCATGDFIVSALKHYQMWGLDVSQFAIESARERLPEMAERLLAGLLEDQDLPTEYFDAVVLWDVIEHLCDPVAVVSQLTNIIKPGGSLLISTPNIGSWMARISGKRWPFMTPPEHVSFFNRRSLQKLFESCGLRLTLWFSRGKWTTLAFLLYKISRMSPGLVPAPLLSGRLHRQLDRLPLYAPTGDIQYAVAVRPD